MALPPAAPDRHLKHRRSIDVQIHACGNGRWEVDAGITDVKTCDVQLASACDRRPVYRAGTRAPRGPCPLFLKPSK
jgi:hypothetical protein